MSGHEPDSCKEGRSVVYVAKDFITGFLEVFGDLIITNSRSSRPVEARICPQWRVAAVQPVTPVRVTNLKGRGCLKIKASPALATGNVSRELSQEWARAIYDHHTQSDGVKYQGAHDYGDCIAIWDRAPELTVGTLLDGATQDYPLHNRDLWRRLIVAGRDVGLPVMKQDRTTCRDCREHPPI